MTIKPFLANLKNNLIPIIAFLLILLFVFLRFYKIQGSLLFYGDLGRDFLVMHDFLQSKKPPLLGPQTSALPFNQSVIYFYLLLPIYLITGKSLFSTLFTNAVFYITLFIIGLIYLKKYPKLQRSLLVVFFLLSIHPQQVIQSRYVWNPSFVSACIIAAFYLFQILQIKFNKKLVFLFTFFIALSTAFSYSAVPALIAFMIVSAFIFGKKSYIIYFYTFLNLILVNFLTIIFELRHNFLLTNMMFYQEKLAQVDIDIISKLRNLKNYLVAIDNSYIALILLIFFIFFILRELRNYKSKPLRQSLVLLLITFFITLILPMAIHSHYIFGLLSLLSLSLSFLKKKPLFILILLISLSYLTHEKISEYFKPTHRTVADSLSCAQSFCQKYKNPIFVASQNSYSAGHDAMGFKYLLKVSGCNIKSLDNQISQAENMIIIVDDSLYEHNKTEFNELTQFGKSKEIFIHTCSDKLKIHILQRQV